MDMELPEDVNTFVRVGLESDVRSSEFHVRKRRLLRLFRDDGKRCTRIHLHAEVYAFDFHLNDNKFSRLRFDPVEKIFLFALALVLVRYVFSFVSASLLFVTVLFRATHWGDVAFLPTVVACRIKKSTFRCSVVRTTASIAGFALTGTASFLITCPLNDFAFFSASSLH